MNTSTESQDAMLQDMTPPTSSETGTEGTITRAQTSVFIPYWNIPESASEVDEFDTLIYFGIAPGENGEILNDSGFTNLEAFIERTPADSKRLLTVRMLKSETNLQILEDPQAQSRVISETFDIARQYGFDGIIIDLEMSVLPLEDIQNDITAFITKFSNEAHGQDLTLQMTVFGDTFYRGRPYDIETLSPHVDGFLIMAYDFHKSRGEPGPNFPFSKRSEPPLNPLLGKEGNERGGYPYSFEEMISDFSSVVPREKITILFGMYGYDWTLGPQGLPLKAARAVPLNEIDTDGAAVDPISKEKYITYIDDDGFNHVLWYEDEESVEVKIKFLREQGIGSVGYWVWGYF